MNTTKAQQHLKEEIDFDSLSSGQKRVLIATDALAQIELDKWKPANRIYWAPTADPKDAQGNPVQFSDGCQVCALGACFVASFIRTPEDVVDLTTRFRDVSRSEYPFGVLASAGTTDSVLGNRLLQFFDERTLGLMEIAFEREVDVSPVTEDTCRDYATEAERAVAFGRRYDEPKNRVIAILKNVIKNCGEFKP